MTHRILPSGIKCVSSLGDMEPERTIVIFTACRAVAQAAIAQVGSCEACNDDADLPFEWILDRVTGSSGATTDYILEEPPACRDAGSW